MRRCVLGLALLCLAVPGVCGAEELRVGALNIEFLGLPNNRSGIAHGIAQDPADLAEYIRKGNLDILGLEEISDDDEDDATRTNSTLTEAFDLLNASTGQDWTHVLFPKKQPNAKDQLVGVAWNKKRVSMVGEPFRLTIQDDPNDSFNVWDRHPHAVKFSAGANKTDIVLVPLHMKSNRGGVATTSKQRGLEASLLVSQLTAIRQHFADDDLVLLGDSNILKKNEQAAAVFVAAGFKDLNDSDTPTTWSGPAPFDRIFVTAGQGEFSASAQTVVLETDKAEHKKRISDHFMVVTTIDVRADDDTGTPVTPVVPGPVNPPATPSGVRISRLLPDPVTDDAENESATILNSTATAVSLAGWKLKDKAGQVWALDSLGQLAPGQSKTIRRGGQPMALNNNGDDIQLLDASGSVIDRATYSDSDPGVAIQFP